MSGIDAAILLLRLAVGGTMMAHGWNHWFGGGKLAGTAPDRQHHVVGGVARQCGV
jgi:hypothetical protein